jgi:hypothetical protein
MKKIVLIGLGILVFAGCTQPMDENMQAEEPELDRVENDSTVLEEEDTLTYVEKDGQQILQGYVTLKGSGWTETFDSYFEQPIEPVEYVYFDIVESSSSLFTENFLNSYAGNSFVDVDGDLPAIGLGCLENGQIKFSNFTLGLEQFTNNYLEENVSEELTSKIMSGEEVEIEVYFETNTGGRGAPLCYSHVVVQE